MSCNYKTLNQTGKPERTLLHKYYQLMEDLDLITVSLNVRKDL